MSDVFCDHLSISMPVEEWDAFRQEVAPLFDMIGARVEFDQQDSRGESRLVLWHASPGTCRAERKGLVMWVSATGAFLAGLRCARIFQSYLATIGSRPHRVTRLDASLDRKEDAAPVLARLVDQVFSDEGLHVTRKRVKSSDATTVMTRRQDGQNTGTLYLGPKHADVRPCIYDKRDERIKAGLPDVGPLTRYECRIRSGVGPTLRDAAQPEAIFWHFMGEVLPVPPEAPVWTRHAEGFELVRPPAALPAARLLRRVESSDDLRDMVRLAIEVGPYGLSLLQGAIAKLHASVDESAPVEVAHVA